MSAVLTPAPLAGAERMLGAVMLAAATFMVVLDITVANVSVATISGDLGVSATQGTWIVTSYAAAQAIAMPLTGWLTRRFGQVRLIVSSVLLFTAASWLCGLAESIETHGLLQPIVVRRLGERYQLISGERRLRAISRQRVGVERRELCGALLDPAGTDDRGEAGG